jgi:type I restriction enzyme M protein
VNLDNFGLKDESSEDTENLPAPEILLTEISENLQSALEQFNSVIEELKTDKNTDS